MNCNVLVVDDSLQMANEHTISLAIEVQMQPHIK